ncbi:hypothetical protein NUW58_g8027 [Xylaria curta]|uniref:Uncharacterized protein n=1 Tax=Xylaria curta TaxID=42375 RepID=A0ACC1NCL6_9PEZI|nr:hypothetical protein NUW58_g8027 [Xylaria curta]
MYDAALYDVLKSPLFPHLEGGISDSNETLSELQARDPLAMQIWKFFSKTKQSLPRQERMENFTWRMMHTNLHRWRKQQDHDERIPVHGVSGQPPISTSSSTTADSITSSVRHNNSEYHSGWDTNTDTPARHTPSAPGDWQSYVAYDSEDDLAREEGEGYGVGGGGNYEDEYSGDGEDYLDEVGDDQRYIADGADAEEYGDYNEVRAGFYER